MQNGKREKLWGSQDLNKSGGLFEEVLSTDTQKSTVTVAEPIRALMQGSASRWRSMLCPFLLKMRRLSTTPKWAIKGTPAPFSGFQVHQGTIWFSGHWTTWSSVALRCFSPGELKGNFQPWQPSNVGARGCPCQCTVSHPCLHDSCASQWTMKDLALQCLSGPCAAESAWIRLSEAAHPPLRPHPAPALARTGSSWLFTPTKCRSLLMISAGKKRNVKQNIHHSGKT